MFCCFCFVVCLLNRHDCYSVPVSLEWNSTNWWRQVTTVRTSIHAQGQLWCSGALGHIQYNLHVHAFGIFNNIIVQTRDISSHKISLGRLTCFARCWYASFEGTSTWDINIINNIVTQNFVCHEAFCKQTHVSLNLHSPKVKILIFRGNNHIDLLMSVLRIWWPYIGTVSLSSCFLLPCHMPA